MKRRFLGAVALVASIGMAYMVDARVPIVGPGGSGHRMVWVALMMTVMLGGVIMMLHRPGSPVLSGDLVDHAGAPVASEPFWMWWGMRGVVPLLIVAIWTPAIGLGLAIGCLVGAKVANATANVVRRTSMSRLATIAGLFAFCIAAPVSGIACAALLAALGLPGFD